MPRCSSCIMKARRRGPDPTRATALQPHPLAADEDSLRACECCAPAAGHSTAATPPPSPPPAELLRRDQEVHDLQAVISALSLGGDGGGTRGGSGSETPLGSGGGDSDLM
jgi:hypothetical protein